MNTIEMFAAGGTGTVTDRQREGLHVGRSMRFGSKWVEGRFSDGEAVPFGRYFSSLRERAGMTQAKVAAQAGCSESYIAALETGKVLSDQIPLRIMLGISEAVGGDSDRLSVLAGLGNFGSEATEASIRAGSDTGSIILCALGISRNVERKPWAHVASALWTALAMLGDSGIIDAFAELPAASRGSVLAALMQLSQSDAGPVRKEQITEEIAKAKTALE